MNMTSRSALRFTGSSRPMGAGDFIWLAALGSAARRPTTADSVCACINTIAAGQWSPSGQLVCDCLDQMACAGHVHFDDAEKIHITAAGRNALSLMLSLPVDRLSTPLGQAGARLKLAFLDLADPEEQQAHLVDLIAAHEQELLDRPDHCNACAAQGCYGRLWSDNQTEHLKRDLAVLRRMSQTIDNRVNALGKGCNETGLNINCISN